MATGLLHQSGLRDGSRVTLSRDLKGMRRMMPESKDILSQTLRQHSDSKDFRCPRYSPWLACLHSQLWETVLCAWTHPLQYGVPLKLCPGSLPFLSWGLPKGRPRMWAGKTLAAFMQWVRGMDNAPAAYPPGG